MSNDHKQFLKMPVVDIHASLSAIRRRFLESVSSVLLILGIIGLPLSLSLGFFKPV